LSDLAYMVGSQTLERRRMKGNWNVSPLWEAKILLGVLKQHGLAGKGLVEAFEKWAPSLVGASRSDVNSVYHEQTGREMSDYILLQQADKVVRYQQFPREAEGIRIALANFIRSETAERSTLTRIAHSVNAARDGTILSARKGAIEKATRLLGSNSDSGYALPSSGLLSTNELADLTGFAPKTIRRWASRRLLNSIRVGNQFRFRPAAVELFLTQHEVRK